MSPGLGQHGGSQAPNNRCTSKHQEGQGGLAHTQARDEGCYEATHPGRIGGMRWSGWFQWGTWQLWQSEPSPCLAPRWGTPLLCTGTLQQSFRKTSYSTNKSV